MTTTTTIRSWPAIGLGAFFAGITGYVLFEDVAHGAPITTSHLQTCAALVGAIAAGHMAWPALSKRDTLFQGLMLVVLALAATAYITVASGARNAETASFKTARIADNNAARVRELQQLARAEGMLTEAERKLDKDCVKGKASKGTCDGIRATVAVYAAAIKGHNATLRELGPELAPTAGYAHAAKVLVAAGVPASAARIEERLSLLMPFVIVLIAELGTVAFLHLGLAHAKAPQTVKEPAPASAEAETPETEKPRPTPPPGGGKRGRKADPKVISFVAEYQARHDGKAPTGAAIMAAFPGMPKSTAYDYAQRVA